MPARAMIAATVLTAAAALASAPARAVAQEGLQPGDVPGPAVVQTLEGDTVSLGALVKDRPALVEFWATWCPICRALEPRMNAAHERFGDDVDFLIVAVGVGQDLQTVARHLQRHPQPGRVLWDARGAAVRAFDAPGTGVIFILDREGRIAYVGAGTGQDLETALARVLRNGGTAR